MLLKLKPHSKNLFPLKAMLLRGAEPMEWLQEIQLLGFTLDQVKVYPLPGDIANSVKGCLVIAKNVIDKTQVGQHELCQQIGELLFVPELSTVVPLLEKEKLTTLLVNCKHLYHPEFGLVPLEKQVSWSSLISLPAAKDEVVVRPADSIFIPMDLKSFKVVALPKEDLLKELELAPKPEKMDNKPLTFDEKAKLKFYQLFFDKNGKPIGIDNLPKGLLAKLASLAPGMENKMGEMRNEMEALEARNRNEVDKLLDLMKRNPEEGLKYAIPIDNEGFSRGGMTSGFNMTRRWFDFSLFGYDSRHRGGGGGVSLNSDNHLAKLRRQYEASAQALIRKGNFEKAAWIYMKLLKDYYSAAQTLEKGKMYQEAAVIYLKYLKNKIKAAQCYEKGNFLEEAIELYIEIEKHEKAGDLLMRNNEQPKAYAQYQLVVNQYLKKNQFVKASLICRNKMDNALVAQELLMTGWDQNMDAYNCLNNYLNNISDNKACFEAINKVLKNKTNAKNCKTFIKVLRHEYNKRDTIAEQVKEVAYQVISTYSEKDRHLVRDLVLFNKEDRNLVKDIGRFVGRNR